MKVQTEQTSKRTKLARKAGAVIAVMLCAVAVASPPVHPKPIVESFTAKVVSVSDGDTITVLRNREQVRVRLEGIDAPESKQEHGAKARLALAELVKGSAVVVEVTGVDRYDRLLAVLRVDGESINERLVKDGWAWHYKEYNADPRLAELEVEAREAKVGLWSHNAPIPPWEFRAIQRRAAGLKNTPPSEAAPGDKTHWLNTSANVRHNSSCRWFEKTKRGRFCTADEGTPCGICGG